MIHAQNVELVVAALAAFAAKGATDDEEIKQMTGTIAKAGIKRYNRSHACHARQQERIKHASRTYELIDRTKGRRRNSYEFSLVFAAGIRLFRGNDAQ